MKNRIMIALFIVITALCFAQEASPMYDWAYTEVVTLNGRRFYGAKADSWLSDTFADSYCEQDGYAIVQGYKLHYWLYDTITYHDGDASDIYNNIIPRWVEQLGYVIDFGNIEVYNPNTDLASSVKALMTQRGCDVSVALIATVDYEYVVINEYFAKWRQYKTTIYYLYK